MVKFQFWVNYPFNVEKRYQFESDLKLMLYARHEGGHSIMQKTDGT